LYSKPVDNYVTDYDSVSTFSVIKSAYSDFVDTLDSTICPITSCELYESTCTTLHNDTSLLTISATSPFDISAIMNHQPGITLSLCVKCYSNGASVDNGPWTYTQNPDCSLDSGWLNTSFASQTLQYSPTAGTYTTYKID
jgi:hypothetical protein